MRTDDDELLVKLSFDPVIDSFGRCGGAILDEFVAEPVDRGDDCRASHCIQ